MKEIYFVTLENSLALRELNFNEFCFACYIPIHTKSGIEYNFRLRHRTSCMNSISVPLYQQAFRWFRSKYGFSYNINKTNGGEFVPYVNGSELNIDNDSYNWIYKTYEEAEQACLKKLIEIAIK